MNARILHDELQAREVPHSVEAEQAVLGALMLDNDAIDRIPDLRTEHLHRHDHRVIFECISKLILAGRAADMITVNEAAGALGKSDTIGGLAYLNRLSQSTPGSAGIVRWAEIVIDRWKLRGVLATAEEVKELVHGRNGRPVSEILDKAQAKFEALSESRATEPRLASQGLSEIIEDIDAQYHGAPLKATATGFTDLDAKLEGGMSDGELIIVAGRPSMGKTAFSMGIGGHVADSAGTVLVFSMEMPEKQLNQRNLARVGRIPLAHVRNGSKMTDADWPALTHATQILAAQPLVIDDTPGLTMMEITNRSRAVKRKHGLKLIIVDYIGLMTGGEGDNLTQQIGYYSRGLKALAKQLNVPVIALSQLNRGLEQRPNKRPIMSDLRDSGAIEQDADTILFLYRDEVYNPDSADKGIAEVIIGKQRNGALGRVGLGFIGEQARFTNLALGTPYGHAQPAHSRAKRGFDE
jgi:replicative DNA helicase